MLQMLNTGMVDINHDNKTLKFRKVGRKEENDNRWTINDLKIIDDGKYQGFEYDNEGRTNEVDSRLDEQSYF